MDRDWYKNKMVKFFQQFMDSFNIFNLISFLGSTKLLLQTISHFIFLHQIFILGSLLYILKQNTRPESEIDLRHQEPISRSGIQDVPLSEHSALLPEAPTGTSVSPRLSWWSQMNKVVLTAYWVPRNIKTKTDSNILVFFSVLLFDGAFPFQQKHYLITLRNELSCLCMLRC